MHPNKRNDPTELTQEPPRPPHAPPQKRLIAAIESQPHHDNTQQYEKVSPPLGHNTHSENESTWHKRTSDIRKRQKANQRHTNNQKNYPRRSRPQHKDNRTPNPLRCTTTAARHQDTEDQSAQNNASVKDRETNRTEEIHPAGEETINQLDANRAAGNRSHRRAEQKKRNARNKLSSLHRNATKKCLYANEKKVWAQENSKNKHTKTLIAEQFRKRKRPTHQQN